MAESEQEHVQRVMARLQVNTVVISSLDNPDERIYVNGELVYTEMNTTSNAGWGW
jgi:hypothetical protein